jgi:tetratricopeptide (TPR) repeat protein
VVTDTEGDEEDADDGDPDDVVYARPSLRGGRRRSSMRRGSRRRVLRAVVYLLVLAAIAGGTYQTYRWFEVQWAAPAAPGKLYTAALALAKEGQYRRASAAFQQFAAMHPADPKRPDAQFQAAYALQRIESGSAVQRQEAYATALGLFEQFIRDNPTYKDSKLARAEVLVGMLHFKLGNYQESIDVLANPELRLRDPGAALASLRVLARAHAQLGEYEATRDAYLRAARLAENRTPDKDYAALAEMYEALAGRADDELARQYRELALLHWRNAVEVPGISPAVRKEIRSSKLTMFPEDTSGRDRGAPVSAPVTRSEGSSSAGGGSPTAGAEDIGGGKPAPGREWENDGTAKKVPDAE